MNSLPPQKRSLGIALTLFCLWGCSHAPVVQEFPSTASPREELTQLESDLNAASQRQVDVLSPESFKSAINALNDSKISLEKQKDYRDSLHEIAVGRAYLKRAEEFSQKATTQLEAVVTARRLATNALAPTSQAKRFEEIDRQLVEVTSAMEKGEQTQSVRVRDRLQAQYMEVELLAIKATHLNQARDLLAVSLKEGAKEFAPRTLAVTEKSIQDTDAYITANRHEIPSIGSRASATLRSAEHLLKITRSSKAGDKVSSEDTALRLESEQLKVADGKAALSGKDEQIERGKAQISRGENQNRVLRGEKLDLEMEKSLARRYDDARSVFSNREAEVYKQGDTLMIRLRGLEFPNSEATLTGTSFPLLSKVQKVIRDFGRSNITVEGHTDSNGGKALNEKLSTLRAQAVREYLVANQSNTDSEIRSIGYDYQKPLASNKTASGRAQNRRVDILIQPRDGTKSE